MENDGSCSPVAGWRVSEDGDWLCLLRQATIVYPLMSNIAWILKKAVHGE